MIECTGLTKEYISDGKPIKAVSNVNLTIQQGDFVVILGHSGSGKTTLLSLIGGLTKPDQGEVLIDNVSNWKQSDQELSAMRNRTIGFIFQFASLIPTLTVIENMMLPMSFGAKTQGGKDLALQLLEDMGLADKANVFPSQLSGGQQRRIAIARAFMNKPRIILADEPTGDLDEETEHEILAFFKKHNEKGVTFLVVTHNSDFGKSQNTPRVIRMRNGVIEEQ